MSTPTGAIIILDRVMQLEHEAHDALVECKRLSDMYNLGYRYITDDGTPHMGHANVTNIAERLI